MLLTSVLPLALQAADRRDRRLAVVRDCGSAFPPGHSACHDACPLCRQPIPVPGVLPLSAIAARLPQPANAHVTTVAASTLRVYRVLIGTSLSLFHHSRCKATSAGPRVQRAPDFARDSAAAAPGRQNTVMTISQFVSLLRRV